MKTFYWLVTRSFKGFFKVLYRFKIYGLEHYIPGRAIIAPNHVSFFDPPIIASSWPEEASFLARKSLFSTRIFGCILRNLNGYPVDGSAKDLTSIKLICQLLNENKKVVIFPEGIRSKDGELGLIKSGIGMLALRCQAPIIPVYISGSYHIWSRHQIIPKPFGRMACIYGSPIDTQRFDNLEKKEAQEAVANAVKQGIEKLKTWYENGAIGSPP